ncbi:MAG: glycosyltransferase [Bacteroidota bacterium]|jgi:cellulose synthase/poly-beta-1,6-N-acetylglucosamine synthase-like glycosyltransferase
MTVLEVDLSFLFVIAVILIWFTIAYQFILTVFGYINYVQSMKEKRELDNRSIDYPTCSILIPAHNEEKVIAATIESMLKLEYPKDKLQIIVINDGSKDATKSIIERYAIKDARIQLFDIPKGEGGKGKSRTLNLGIKQAKGDVIAIYDADNTPDKDSLRYLVAQLLLHKELGAVIGKFRTVNKNATLLTRFINIETLSFQSMLQAGRWQMHGISTLPGTNFVMWHHIIKKLGGWDEEALTEDSELSIRIYEEGYKIKYIPYAITYEQEPQQWGTWIKQRMRWVRGNNYVVKKFWKEIPHFKSKRMAFDLLYTLSLYYIFFVAVVFSDILFLVSLFQLVAISLPGPYTFVWVTSLILFLFELFLSISYDGEDSLTNLAIIILMYFTYSQLWIYVVIKSVYQDLIKKEKRIWDKTVRFDVPAAHS